ncbi:MAG TPA: T9SS type A sorting domain-containing protein [Lentimicrobium sp.]|nr:T9SS type A sorting domain-containing protein [Lentimicrobium sp.]
MKIFTIALLALSLNVYTQTPSFLNANASAQPEITCSGNSVQLMAIASGGTENYTYLWSSYPEGFTSTIAQPVVTPMVTTLYSVEVNDGINVVSQNVTVTVNPLPVINLIPAGTPGIEIINQNEISTCPFNSVILDAGNPGCLYLWNNGSTEQKVTAQTSGISFDYQAYEVMVTNPETGCSNSLTLSVNFDFEFCTYGFEEKIQDKELIFYPNPSTDGMFSCNTGSLNGNTRLEIYTSTGVLLKNILLSPSAGPSSSFIDLHDQATGMYFIKFAGTDSDKMHKILIQR